VSDTVRFGVIGATSVVSRQAIHPALAAVDGVSFHHAATRSGAPVDGAARTSDDYAAVLDDPEVDVVYIPLPNHLHEEWVVACAEAGKHVLCEKPLAMDAGSARRMADACAAAGVHLLEAYMSPYHPRSRAVQAAVERGDLGELLHGEARMSGVMDPDNHRWAVANGGGALLDVGIYCLEPILSAAGWGGTPPVEVAASVRRGGDGVDATTAAWLRLDSGVTASIWVSFEAPDQQRLVLTGTERSLEVHHQHATPMRPASGYLLRERDGSTREVATDSGDCYEGMLAHVRDVVRGQAEPERPPARSIALAELLDTIAQAAGLRG
jgi:xylose dehydrogenase (NAD/NADP)